MKTRSTLPAFLAIFVFAAPLLLTGCANLSSHQTARVLEPDQHAWSAGGGVSRIPHFYAYPDSARKNRGGPLLPYIDIGIRTGILPKLDAGARVTLLGTFGGDIKYQLFDGKSLALAAGLGLGFGPVSWSDSSRGLDEDGQEDGGNIYVDLLDVILPLYASYDVTDWCTVYANPKFVYRVYWDFPVRQSLVGASAGIRLGKTKGIFFEATPMRILGTGITKTQWSAAWFHTFGAAKAETEEKP